MGLSGGTRALCLVCPSVLFWYLLWPLCSLSPFSTCSVSREPGPMYCSPSSLTLWLSFGFGQWGALMGNGRQGGEWRLRLHSLAPSLWGHCRLAASLHGKPQLRLSTLLHVTLPLSGFWKSVTLLIPSSLWSTVTSSRHRSTPVVSLHTAHLLNNPFSKLSFNYPVWGGLLFPAKTDW